MRSSAYGNHARTGNYAPAVCDSVQGIQVSSIFFVFGRVVPSAGHFSPSPHVHDAINAGRCMEVSVDWGWTLDEKDYGI